MPVTTILRPTMAAACLLLCAAAQTVPATAQPSDAVDPAALRACVANAQELGTSPNGCVTRAHQPCLQHSPDTPAVIALCFENARSTWAAEIAARMETLSAEAPERLAALAGIEVKYDLRSGLLQCDRQEELGRLGEAPTDQILVQKTRCAATATGLAYVRLLWRVSKQ